MTAEPLGQRHLRVAIAGAGAISQYHLTGWREMRDVELVAICDPAIDKAHAKANEHGIANVYSDFEAMLRETRPDAVDIITPVATHAPLTRIAANLGIHVCAQKPLCPTVAEARALIDDVGDRVRFMVHENYRYRPHYVRVREWLNQGKIGRVLHARMSVRSASMLTGDGSEPPLLKRQPYLAHFKRLLVFEVLIHHLDVLRVLLGPLHVAHAHLAKVNQSLAGEDVAIITLTGRDGLTVVIDANISAPGYPPLPADRLEVMGNQGTLIFDRDRLWLEGSRTEPVTFDLMKNYQRSFTGAVEDFVNGLRSGKPFATEANDNIKTIELMEACYIAAGVPIE